MWYNYIISINTLPAYNYAWKIAISIVRNKATNTSDGIFPHKYFLYADYCTEKQSDIK